MKHCGSRYQRRQFLLVFICLLTLLKTRSFWHNTRGSQLWYIEDIWEQLGKAKFHLLEQAFISSEVQRTLILPNVGQSQIGMRYSHTFDLYYQIEPISRVFLTTSVHKFRCSWLDSRQKKRTLTAALVYILVVGQCSKRHLTWSDVRSETWLQIKAKYDIKPFQHPACFETNYGWAAPTYPQPIIDYLRQTHSETDIIVAIKDSYFFLMDPAVMPVHVLQHNQTLISLAEAFATRHRPYAAVHWRMEEAKGDGLECARILVNTTQRYIPSHRVYFATDHPFEHELKSASFNSCCRSDQTQGYKHVINTLHPFMFSDVPSSTLGGDSGSFSIVEKLICEQSNVFLAGNAPCDRHGAFGREMIKFRQVIARTPWLYWSQPNATYEPHKDYPW